MTIYAYTAFDSKGKLFRGSLQEKSWTQALRRVKEMGLFPTSVKEKPQRAAAEKVGPARDPARSHDQANRWPSFGGTVPTKVLTAFTGKWRPCWRPAFPFCAACVASSSRRRTVPCG